MSNIHNFSAHFALRASFNGALTAATQNGTSVDTQGFRRAAVVLDMYTGAATTVNFQLQDSPDNATWTNVTGGTLGAAIVASTTEFNQIVDVDLAKRQRYLRVQIIGTGTAGNASAQVLLYEAWNAPPTETNAVITL